MNWKKMQCRTSDRKGERKRVAEQRGAMEPKGGTLDSAVFALTAGRRAGQKWPLQRNYFLQRPEKHQFLKNYFRFASKKTCNFSQGMKLPFPPS